MYNKKRTDIRLIIAEAVILEIAGHVFRGAQCYNISMGGMFISLEPEVLTEIQQGDVGTLTLTCEINQEHVSLFAGFRVAWVRNDLSEDHPSGVGLQVIDVSEENNDKLIRILDAALVSSNS